MAALLDLLFLVNVCVRIHVLIYTYSVHALGYRETMFRPILDVLRHFEFLVFSTLALILGIFLCKIKLALTNF